MAVSDSPNTVTTHIGSATGADMSKVSGRMVEPDGGYSAVLMAAQRINDLLEKDDEKDS